MKNYRERFVLYENELNNRNEILKQLEEPLLEVTPLQEVSIEVMIIRNREMILILIILLVIVIF